MNLIKNVPIPICGLILALLSLGNLTQEIHPYLRILFGSIGIIFLILILLKLIFHTNLIKKDFKNPVIASSSGTFSMSLMILSDANKPLICIFTAVLSILIVGYLNAASAISIEFISVLYLFACIFYIFALLKFIEYRNLDFYPSFSAFTFPFVISALATKGILSKMTSNAILNGILKIETAIAIVIVCYILIRYIKFLKNSYESRN